MRREKGDRTRESNLVETPPDRRFSDFSKMVMAFRKDQGLTQEQLGAKLGVTGTQVRLWEKSKALPRQKVVVAFCELAGIEVPLSTVRDGDHRIPLKVGTCVVCGNPFPVYKLGVDHCGKACSGKTNVAGRSDGFVKPQMPEGTKRIIHAAGGGYIKIKVNGEWLTEHRHVMEQHINRPLESHEIVHHKNGNRSDNSLENLELWKVKTKDPKGIRAADYHCPGCRCFEHHAAAPVDALTELGQLLDEAIVLAEQQERHTNQPNDQ